MVVQTFFFVQYNPYPVNAPQCSVDENVRFIEVGEPRLNNPPRNLFLTLILLNMNICT